MSVITCCKNCKNRKFACHDTCCEYLSQKQQHEKRQANIRSLRSADNEMQSYIKESNLRMARKSKFKTKVY